MDRVEKVSDRAVSAECSEADDEDKDEAARDGCVGGGASAVKDGLECEGETVACAGSVSPCGNDSSGPVETMARRRARPKEARRECLTLEAMLLLR